MFRKLEDIDVWKMGCRLAVKMYSFTDKEPLNKDWGLRDQLRRAAVSVPSNIAEGYERNSQAEFRRFLLIAKGSCGELKTQLYIVKALGYLPDTDLDNLIGECSDLSNKIGSLSAAITRSKVKKGSL